MGHLKYKGYSGSVEYNTEDEVLFGKVLGMNKDLILYEGTNVSNLKKNFEQSIDDYLENLLLAH